MSPAGPGGAGRGAVSRNSAQAGGRTVGLPPMVERPDQPIRAKLSFGSFVVVGVARPLWLRRREAALVGLVAGFAGVAWWLTRDRAPVVAWPSLLGGSGSGPGSWSGLARSWLAWAVARPWSLGAGVIPAAVLAGVPWLRLRVRRWLRRGKLVRSWDSGTRHAGLTTLSDRVPRIVGPITWRSYGESFTARVPKSQTVGDLEDACEAVAVVMDVRTVTAVRDPDRARYATVYISRKDPFAEADPDPWPWLNAPSVDFGGPIPIGIKETGEPATIRMLGKNIMVGGEPESGKSVAASQIIGAGALDPTVRIWGWDAKQVELSMWDPVLERVAYNDMETAIGNLRDLIELMDQRYASMAAAGRRTATAEDGPIYLAVFDELRFFTAHEDGKLKKEFSGLLTDLIARGRAARFVTLAATQKPSTDVVPSAIRDLVGYRWALRCTTRDASDTILGAGMSGEGYSAADIPISTRGVGLLHAEGGFPEKVRSHYLSDSEIEEIADRGAKLRANAGLAA